MADKNYVETQLGNKKNAAEVYNQLPKIVDYLRTNYADVIKAAGKETSAQAAELQKQAE